MDTLEVFLLTREWRDTASGVELCFWGTTGEQAVKIIISRQPSVCFIRRGQQLAPDLARLVTRREPLGLKNLGAQAVDGLYFTHQRQLREFSQLAKNQGIRL